MIIWTAFSLFSLILKVIALVNRIYRLLYSDFVLGIMKMLVFMSNKSSLMEREQQDYPRSDC